MVVYAFDNGQARASRVDPASGQALGEVQPSATMRWFKNLHRSFLLGDAGRWAAAGIALAMGLISVSGLVLLARNYRIARGPGRRAGEIDLVMREPDGTVVFVEVRYRRGGAARGGYGAVCAMPNTVPVADTPEICEYQRARGREVGLVDVVPIGAVTVGENGEQVADIAAMGAVGVRMFSDDG